MMTANMSGIKSFLEASTLTAECAFCSMVGQSGLLKIVFLAGKTVDSFDAHEHCTKNVFFSSMYNRKNF